MPEASIFPYQDAFVVNGEQFTAAAILERLQPQLTSAREARIDQVIEHRSFTYMTVLENIYDRGNASAVFRSAEAFGFPSVHLIETGERFKNANRVSQGAEKWLARKTWFDSEACVKHLKTAGYSIIATHLNDKSLPLAEWDFTRPTALVLGNEKDGVSEAILKNCDAVVKIPMYGFVQSFNISVAGALCFQQIHLQRIQRLGKNGDLTEQQKKILKAIYFLQTRDDGINWKVNSHWED